jgi:hypothetical protein
MGLCLASLLARVNIGGWLGQTVSVTAQERSAVAKVLAAEEFRLVDSSGRVRAALAFSSSGHPFLDMKDESDIARLSLSLPNQTGETGIALRNVDTKARVVMSVDEKVHPSLVMRDRDHNTNGFQPLDGNR